MCRWRLRKADGGRTKAEEVYQDCKIIQGVKEFRFLMFHGFEVFDAKEAFEVIRFCFYISDSTSNDL